MASLSLSSQFETNLMLNRNVIELLLQLKSAKVHGKKYIKVKAHLVRHLLRNRLLFSFVQCDLSLRLVMWFVSKQPHQLETQSAKLKEKAIMTAVWKRSKDIGTI